MKRIFAKLSNQMKLTICVVSLIGTELMCAQLAGLFESQDAAVTAGRADLCEAVAVNFSLLAMSEDTQTMRRGLKAIAKRNKAISSIGVRRESGELLIDIGEHSKQWVGPVDNKSSSTQMIVPISSQDGRWGTIEMQFEEATHQFIGWLRDPFLRLLAYLVPVSFLIFYMFFRKVLRQLNPAKVIPGRVRSALDTLTEGLLILDKAECIVLANEAFGNLVGRDPEKLLGLSAHQLPWLIQGTNNRPQPAETPWRTVFETDEPSTGALFDFAVSESERRTLLANASPVCDPKGKTQGVLVSVDDVTPMERKKRELKLALTEVQQKSEEIRRQNEELEKLATTDPLTECLNRRSFFEQFEDLWAKSEAHQLNLSVVMVDIDFFKSINDEHGHSVGDDVLRGIAAVLRETARVGDLVCRFGGEEFCVLLPNTDTDTAFDVAERFRLAIEARQFPQLSCTASLGVSSSNLGAQDGQGMIDQADKCLYVAKRNGRNQVVRFDSVPDDLEVDESAVSRTRPVEESTAEIAAQLDQDSIPYRAVAALLSTLAYRHPESAAHSRRVADLSVAVAESLVSPREAYIIELAALLHDIGKMGVPDAILLKPGALTKDEWEVMRHHDRIGIEIVRASFDSEPINAIVSSYRLHFAGDKNRIGELVGKAIPLGARIISIADAWDAMTTDRPYRQAMSTKEAIAELRRCAGNQFDPDLVERFISVIQIRSQKPQTSRSTSIPRTTAHSIGQQIERLLDAFEHQDFDRMKSLVDRLEEVARQDGANSFADQAHKLSTSISNDSDLLEILADAQHLIESCRTCLSDWLHYEESIRVTLT